MPEKPQRQYKKGERHHWWPLGVSNFWTEADGKINWITPAGEINRAHPKTIARISDGHNIRYDAPSPWDQTFEQDFDNADGHFPEIIEWICELTQAHETAQEVSDGFKAHTVEDEQLALLTECLISLAVRSPKFRSHSVALAEDLRGPLDPKERKRLAAANQLHAHNAIVKRIGIRAKYVVLFSQSREFVFGDGFPTSISRWSMDGRSGEHLLVPLTPAIAVLFAQPGHYTRDPRLMTKLVTATDVETINECVMVHAKDYVFFRSEKPPLFEHYSIGQHQRFTEGGPVTAWINQIPGVHNRMNRFFRI